MYQLTQSLEQTQFSVNLLGGFIEIVINMGDMLFIVVAVAIVFVRLVFFSWCGDGRFSSNTYNRQILICQHRSTKSVDIKINYLPLSCILYCVMPFSIHYSMCAIINNNSNSQKCLYPWLLLIQ